MNRYSGIQNTGPFLLDDPHDAISGDNANTAVDQNGGTVSLAPDQQLAMGTQNSGQSAGAATSNAAAAASSTEEPAGQYYLPGAGVTYLNPDFADKLAALIVRAQNRGIQLNFSSGYRDRAKQEAERLHDPTARNPATNSLHSAGRAVDIQGWDAMDPMTQAAIRADAASSGLQWGGTFKNPGPDGIHFQLDTGTDRNQLIDNFTRAINAQKAQIPDY